MGEPVGVIVLSTGESVMRFVVVVTVVVVVVMVVVVVVVVSEAKMHSQSGHPLLSKIRLITAPGLQRQEWVGGHVGAAVTAAFDVVAARLVVAAAVVARTVPARVKTGAAVVSTANTHSQSGHPLLSRIKFITAPGLQRQV